MTNTASGWFQVAEITEKVFLIREPEHVQCYLIVGQARSMLLDTGTGFCDIRSAVEPLCQNEITVLNTHWHFDHIGCNAHFARIGISMLEQHKIRPDLSNRALMDVYIRPCQREGLPFPGGFRPETYHVRGSTPTFCIAGGDRFDLGGRTLEAIATPGHTHGSLSFLDHHTRSLFCGDLVYDGSLYAHFDDSDLREYQETLQTLINRQPEFDALYPAHNTTPLPASFLVKVLNGIEAILDNQVQASVNETWGEPVHSYEFDGFGILTKMPGTAGVKLFRA